MYLIPPVSNEEVAVVSVQCEVFSCQSDFCKELTYYDEIFVVDDLMNFHQLMISFH